MSKFSHLSSNQLTSLIKQKSEAERHLTVEVIELLEEMEARKLYLSLGFGSLMEFCVKELKYSESAAYRRISAMRLGREIPQVKEALEDGTLNLVSVTQAQVLFREKAAHERPYTSEEKIELLKSLENTSKREAERIIAEERPETAPRRDEIRAIAGNRFLLNGEITDETWQVLERLKELLSHQDPNPSFNNLLSMIGSIALKAIDPLQKPVRRKAQPPVVAVSTKAPKNEVEMIVPLEEARSSVAKQSAIPRNISPLKRRLVWQAAKGQCSFVDSSTGRQCESRHQLEVDHFIPVAKGGSADAGNLRLLCRAHNQLLARQHFGREKMAIWRGT